MQGNNKLILWCRICNELFKNKFNVETTIVDVTDLKGGKESYSTEYEADTH